jgi:tRNA(Ile)-lysidine synthase
VLRRALRGPCALPAGTRLIVAASGGADSTALLIGLHHVAPEFGLRLTAAHLHHGLRGSDADDDLAAVEALCAKLGIPLVQARWNVVARMKRRGLGGENGMRTVRRAFLGAVARRAGGAAVATAHTADDQLETVLMRLLRGSGLRGLGGMRLRSGGFLKPLLGATREEIEADLMAAGIAWREDATNRDPGMLRNRIRHAAIPALLAALDGPRQLPARRGALARRVAAAAAEAQAAASVVSAWASDVLSRSRRIKRDAMEFSTAAWSAYPIPVRRLLLRHAWESLAPALPGLTHRHLAALGQLLGARPGRGQVRLPGGWAAEKSRSGLWFGRADSGFGDGAAARSGRTTQAGAQVSRAMSVRTRWVDGLHARKRLGRPPVAGEFFAASGIEGTVQLRVGRADEAFVPFGRSRPVRVGEFLKRQRVSRDIRECPRVLADARGILWIVGVRRAARAPVTPRTRRALWVIAEPHAHVR